MKYFKMNNGSIIIKTTDNPLVNGELHGVIMTISIRENSEYGWDVGEMSEEWRLESFTEITEDEALISINRNNDKPDYEKKGIEILKNYYRQIFMYNEDNGLEQDDETNLDFAKESSLILCSSTIESPIFWNQVKNFINTINVSQI